MTRKKRERDAVVRLRAAFLDLQSAQRYSEANDVLAIIERIEPPQRGEAAGSGLPAARAGRSESGDVVPPASSAPATSRIWSVGASAPLQAPCGSCGESLATHCTTHLLPCCPGSLMHGQDEGTWTP